MKTALLTTGALAVALWSPAHAGTYYGSGVIIGPHEILTANHVIDECGPSITINQNGAATKVIARDAQRDLAVLHVYWEMSKVNTVSFHNGSFRIGDEVIVTGYPLSGMAASSLNLTTGILSAAAGYKNTPDEYTITAPVQPGNSGGPLLDNNGDLVGIVISRLKSELAQNVNFAIKYSVVENFLDENHIKYQIAESSKTKLTVADVGEKAKLFTASIECSVPESATSEPHSGEPNTGQPRAGGGGGYWWSKDHGNYWVMESGFDDGRILGLALIRDVGLVALISKPSWFISPNAHVAASVQIDSWSPLGGSGMALPDFPHSIVIPVQPRIYNALLYQMFEGWWATVRFSGNEPPWQVSLKGVKASWPAFIQCAQHVSPEFVDAVYTPSILPQ